MRGDNVGYGPKLTDRRTTKRAQACKKIVQKNDSSGMAMR